MFRIIRNSIHSFGIASKPHVLFCLPLQKMEAYKRWGCSEDEVLTTFKILPWIMSLSVEKIDGVMSLCVNEMGWQPSEVMRKYFVLTLSLNKRIVPRWSVYRELESKGWVKGKCKVRKLFTMKEDLFLEQYVIRYIDEVPSLLKRWKLQSDLALS